ncbi:integrase [Rudaea sp.]|uniref:integrase n=1 Tax=Rudaea sp. TaxID=2136325 RepID=UPI003785011F
MITYQNRSGNVRAIVRRKGIGSKSKTFPTKGLAKTWAERIEREFAEREARGDTYLDDMTLAELIDWHDLESRRAKSTITLTQRGNLTRLREGLGHIAVSKLRPMDIVEHVKRRVYGQHQRSDRIIIPPCTPATMRVEIGYLADLLALGQASGKVRMNSNPVPDARIVLRKLHLLGASKLRERRPTPEELDKLRRRFDEQRWRMKIPMRDIMDFAILTARREGEITRLRWADLDEQSRTIVLHDVKHPRRKIGNHRRFPLLGEALEIIQRQPRVSEFIFPYVSDSIGNAFREACKALNIADLHFHDLRHEATSRLFEVGLSIEQVALVTLHRNWADLKRYANLNPCLVHERLAAAKTQTPSVTQQYAALGRVVHANVQAANEELG